MPYKKEAGVAGSIQWVQWKSMMWRVLCLLLAVVTAGCEGGGSKEEPAIPTAKGAAGKKGEPTGEGKGAPRKNPRCPAGGTNPGGFRLYAMADRRTAGPHTRT